MNTDKTRGEVMVLGLGGQNILSQIIEGAKHTILPLCPLNFLNIEGAAAPSAPPITTPLDKFEKIEKCRKNLNMS